MAINKFMMAALRALSYPNLNIKTTYMLNRRVDDTIAPGLSRLFKFSDRVIRSEDGNAVPVRIFRPPHPLPDEVILFFHGGGWVLGNIDTYTKLCSDLSIALGRTVASVDYRLAPEFPFPAALHDCYSAARAFCTLPPAPGLHIPRVVLMGDSAGANLAAAVSLLARDRGEFSVERQVLVYPAAYHDHSEASPFPSVRENGRDYLLTSRQVEDYTDLYIADPADRESPYFSLLSAPDLSHQPRTLIITAEFDPLRDEGEAYAERLHRAGGDVTLYRMRDALHGFLSLPARFTHVAQAKKLIGSFLDKEVTGIR